MKTYRSIRLIYRLLLIGIFLSILPSGINGQIVIDSSDMPFPGDIINVSTGLNVDFIDYTETGENYTWDFSSLLPIYQTADTFVSPSETPFTYQFFFMGRTNLAYRYIQDLPIPDFELTNVFYYYKNSQSNFNNVGYAASLNVLPLPFVLSNPDIIYRFPLEYNNQDSSVSGLVYNLPETAFLSIDRKRVNKVDGWGTLTTPYGTFDVLRMTSEVTEYDSIYIDSLETGIPVNRHYIEYKWIAKGQKIPVLKITSDVSGLIVTYTDSIRTELNAIEENLEGSDLLHIYPNPASHDVFIEYTAMTKGEAEILLFDLEAKAVFMKKEIRVVEGLNRSKISLKEKGIPNGTYIMVIRTAGRLWSKKLILSN